MRKAYLSTEIEHISRGHQISQCDIIFPKGSNTRKILDCLVTFKIIDSFADILFGLSVTSPKDIFGFVFHFVYYYIPGQNMA